MKFPSYSVHNKCKVDYIKNICARNVLAIVQISEYNSIIFKRHNVDYLTTLEMSEKIGHIGWENSIV